MAKKREPKESAYQADKEAVPLSSHQLRAWAAELRDLADNLDSRAQDMDVLEASPMMVFVKGFTNATAAQWAWLARQFVPKLMSAAVDKGRKISVELK